MTYYYHVGRTDLAARLLLQGWTLVNHGYEPVSPCIDGAWWFRLGAGCPARALTVVLGDAEEAA